MQGSARKDVVFGAARVYTVTVPGPKWKSWFERNLRRFEQKWERAWQPHTYRDGLRGEDHRFSPEDFLVIAPPAIAERLANKDWELPRRSGDRARDGALGRKEGPRRRSRPYSGRAPYPPGVPAGIAVGHAGLAQDGVLVKDGRLFLVQRHGDETLLDARKRLVVWLDDRRQDVADRFKPFVVLVGHVRQFPVPSPQ